tara:strand:- start:234 stop:512 length:279 start_codon:yes stop_codon:yes gene_type:complete
MAFKMNKNNVNFGEGTGSSPNKFSAGFVRNVVENAQGKRIDIPVDGGSDTVGSGNKIYAPGFGPEGADNNQIQSLLENIQNLLQGAGLGSNN